jgi:hypothetical protein
VAQFSVSLPLFVLFSFLPLEFLALAEPYAQTIGMCYLVHHVAVFVVQSLIMIISFLDLSVGTSCDQS